MPIQLRKQRFKLAQTITDSRLSSYKACLDADEVTQLLHSCIVLLMTIQLETYDAQVIDGM